MEILPSPGDNLTYFGQKISLADVTLIKFGWLPVRLYHFTIGSRYIVELTTADDRIKIDFESYFGAFKQRQRENFNMFLDVIWDSTVVRLVNSMADDLNNGKVVRIGKCSVTANGILVKGFLIEWNDLSYQRIYNRLTLNSKSNTPIWTNLYYTETDNAHVLMNFLEWRFKKA